MALKQSTNPYGYKNLLVYKKAEALQSECAALTSHFPPFSPSTPSTPSSPFSRFKTLSALADQMDRSARSVKQNIVEGWKRNSTKEYHQFLGFSLGANAELEEDCNDIIKGVYDAMGLKGVEKGEKEGEGKGMEGGWGKGAKGEEKKGEMGKGAAGALRPPQREPLPPSLPPSTPPPHFSPRETPSAPLPHFSPLTLDEVERLPFYPLDTRLPLVVQLKLRCKELNLLLDKLQHSLVDKMSADRTLGTREAQSLARGREAANDVWLQKEREKREI